MTIWNDPLTGVIVGGAITLASSLAMQVYIEHRAGRRETRAAKAKAVADWATLQAQTIVDLQEQLEEATQIIGMVVADRNLSSQLRQFDIKWSV